MARNSAFSRDVAKLAERQRAGLGEPPSMEDLAALNDGVLPEAEADRVREWLAVDPELAATYLELQQLPDLDASAAGGTSGFDTDADVDAAWQELSAKLEGNGASSVVHTEADRFRGPARRRRLLGLAAALIVGLGIGWLLRSSEEVLPEGQYHPVMVTDAVYRDSRIEVSAEHVGIEFEIALSDVTDDGALFVELMDSKGQPVRQQRITFEPRQGSVSFLVAVSQLIDEETYQLLVEPPAQRAEEPFVFRLYLAD